MTNSDSEESLSGTNTSNKPLFIKGGVAGEPVKYLGVMPYDLDKYEFSVLRKSFDNKTFWFNASLGATAGFIFLLIAKLIQLAIAQKPLSFEYYEIIAIVVGGLVSWFLRKPEVCEDEQEKLNLIKDISAWFDRNPKRNIWDHVTSKKGGEK